MKKKDYVPQYSLSIKILALMMTKRELNTLVKKYVETKKENWGTYNK